MQMLISDTNIFFDLREGNLLDLFFRLPYQFAVSDVVYHEELAHDFFSLLELGLQVLELNAASMQAVSQLTRVYTRPSRNDLFGLQLAKERQCPLLTGDQALRSAAKKEHVAVHGTVWVLEELYRFGLCPKSEILLASQKMQSAGRRLPWDIIHQTFSLT